jgi:succinyl-diaminopimelate desuccinylase
MRHYGIAFTFDYLYRLRDRLRGRLTLTVVSDEETFGPWGARYLIEHHPEVHGDCCLSGEPSDPTTIRFGEKGPLWVTFAIRTAGAHGAYPHLSDSATKIAARLISDLDALTQMEVPLPSPVAAVLDRSTDAIDRALGHGAAAIVGKVTFNAGVIRGGLKVNMIPGECSVEGDFRLPAGLSKRKLMAEIDKIVARYPQVSFEETNFSNPNWCDPEPRWCASCKPM